MKDQTRHLERHIHLKNTSSSCSFASASLMRDAKSNMSFYMKHQDLPLLPALLPVPPADPITNQIKTKQLLTVLNMYLFFPLFCQRLPDVQCKIKPSTFFSIWLNNLIKAMISSSCTFASASSLMRKCNQTRPF